MNTLTNILIKFIKGYKFLISPLLGQSDADTYLHAQNIALNH